ncbi:hypothetical protein PG995_010754 [Apiospora arundinis]
MDKSTSSQPALTTRPLATSSHWASSKMDKRTSCFKTTIRTMIDKAVHAETFLLEHIPSFNPETTFRAFPQGITCSASFLSCGWHFSHWTSCTWQSSGTLDHRASRDQSRKYTQTQNSRIIRGCFWTFGCFFHGFYGAGSYMYPVLRNAVFWVCFYILSS